ncbi:hypothetical protein MRX96_035065 [Rhipicephalus microplus]
MPCSLRRLNCKWCHIMQADVNYQKLFLAPALKEKKSQGEVAGVVFTAIYFPPTQTIVDSKRDITHVPEIQQLEQEEPLFDGRVSQLETVNLRLTYEPNRLELPRQRQPRTHEGPSSDVAATAYPSLTWTLTCPALEAHYACACGYVAEVFSPVSEMSGYLVKLYARWFSKGGCAVLSFCAQLCANIDSRAASSPFRDTLKFIIHHPTCPAKSRLYIVPMLQDVTVSAVGKTLFSLTGPIPVTTLLGEELCAGGCISTFP